MGARLLPALAVVFSLTAPPFVGLVCAWVCAEESHHEMSDGTHHHGAAEAAGARIAGYAECDHAFGTLQLFSPTLERQVPAPLSQAVSAGVLPAALSFVPAQPATDHWSPPDDRVLSPPHRSLVLRI